MLILQNDYIILNQNILHNNQQEFIIDERIVSGPTICGGEACIKGTRIPVHIIPSHLAAGDDYDTVLANFPRLSLEDIKACLEYASYLATEKDLAMQ